LGQYNVFIGYQAGYSTTGYHGDMFPTDGDNNIFVGYQAGYSNTIGEQNLYIGAFSGRLNEEGIDNTFLGSRSGEYNTGYGNTLLGTYAGGWHQLNNASKNTIVGSRAGNYVTTGSNNVYIGREAAGYNATGSNNVYVGHLTGYQGSASSNNIFIGNMAGRYETGSNKLYIHNSDANSSGALIWGDFSAKQLRLNANVGVNTAPTGSKFYAYDERTNTVDDPAVIGEHKLNTSGWGIGVKGDGGYIGVYAVSTVSGTGTRYGIYAVASGGQTNWAGYFAGSVYTTGTYQSSDINFKKGISPLSGALDKVLSMQGVSYQWKSKQEISDFAKKDGKDIVKYNFPEGTQIGVIAQDIEKIIPEVVNTDSDGFKSVDYTKLTPLLIEAIKEQQQVIQNQQKQIESQNMEYNELKERLEKLEKLLIKNE
jgi:hypothetical protein